MSCVRKSLLFRFGVSGTRAPTSFRLAARTLGVRLNTYPDSLEPVRALGRCPSDLNRLARAAIQRRGPVQKHSQFTHPLSIQDADGCPLVPRGTGGLQLFADVQVGRRRQILAHPGSLCLSDSGSLRLGLQLTNGLLRV